MIPHATLNEPSDMTPERLRECLYRIWWTPKDLAIVVGLGTLAPIERWLSGEEPVPKMVADWMERLARGR